MNEKTIQCLSNPLQHVPIYLQQFPSYSTRKCKKNRRFHVLYCSPHFCFPWRHPCDYHAICCMDEKTIQCLPNPSQHVSIYLQQFPSYTSHKSSFSLFSHCDFILYFIFIFIFMLHVLWLKVYCVICISVI